MKKTFLMIFMLGAFFAGIPSHLFAQEVSFSRDLFVGSRGADVLFLQQILNRDPETRVAEFGAGSLGQETEYFGLLTQKAVMKFQQKYRSEVLYPAGLFVSTGHVGPMTRAKMTNLALSSVTPFPNTTNNANPTLSLAMPSNTPTVTSIVPSKVRRGDTVTITGTNFTKTGNTVIIADGLLWSGFSNLSSPDGKTITFTYKPPVANELTEADVRALPTESVKVLEDIFVNAGGKLSDIWTSYPNIHSEVELREVLERNGRSFDEMYHYFWLNVKNSNGAWESEGPLLYGLRSFPFEKIASDSSLLSRFGPSFFGFLSGLFPYAFAAEYGGGLNTGKTTSCDCSGGYLAFHISYGGKGFGTYVYYYGSGFKPSTVSTAQSPNMWLGFFKTLGAPANCWKMATYSCYFIPANKPKNPIGFSIWPSF